MRWLGLLGGMMVNAQAIETGKFLRCVLCCAGHTRNFRVVAHQVLQRNGVEDPSLRLYRQSFLRFHRRLQTILPLTIFHDPSGEFIHELYPAVLNNIIDILAHQRARLQRKVHSDQQITVLLVVQVLNGKGLFSVFAIPRSVRKTFRAYSSCKKSW